MRITSALVALAALASASAAFGAGPRDPERQLGRELAGRVAGPPVRCIDYSSNWRVHTVEGVGFIYEGPGNTLYLNRPSGNLRSLNSWNIPVQRITGGSLCEREIVNLLDSSTRSLAGFVSLGTFVPYRRPR